MHEDSKNLSKIRNAGIRATTGEVLITVDADSMVSSNIFQEIEKVLHKRSIVGGVVIIIPERWSVGIALTGIILLPFIICERLSGGLFFARREDVLVIGGFNEDLVSAEDIDFARRLKKYGSQSRRKFVTLWKSPLTTSCRKFDTFGDWFFLKNPFMVIELLRGKNQRYSNKVWYDYDGKSDR